MLAVEDLVIKVFDDSDRVGVLLPTNLPNHVEGLLEVYEHMVDVLLVLEIFLTGDS